MQQLLLVSLPCTLKPLTNTPLEHCGLKNIRAQMENQTLFVPCCHSNPKPGRRQLAQGVTTGAILAPVKSAVVCGFAQQHLDFPPTPRLPQELKLHITERGFVLPAANGCGGNGWRSAAWWINSVSQQLVGALITVCLF